MSYPRIRFIWQHQIAVSSQEVLEKNGQSIHIHSVKSSRNPSKALAFCFATHCLAQPFPFEAGETAFPGRTTTEKELFTQDGVETLFCNKKDLGNIGHCNS